MINNKVIIADASKWQLNLRSVTRKLDFQKAVDKGVDGIIIKYMENQHVDKGYEILLNEAREHFKFIGIYWMHRYDADWIPQVDMVSAECQKQLFTLPPFADWEVNAYMGKLPARPAIHRVQTLMINRMFDLCGYQLGFYGSQWLLWDEEAISADEMACPLWVSTLNDKMDYVPNIGPFDQYFLQQYTSKAKGILYGFEQGTLDLSVANYDVAGFTDFSRRWISKEARKETEPVQTCDLCATCSSADWKARSGTIPF